MEGLCGQAAGSHRDLTSDESPLVISYFTSQIELGFIGGAAPLCRLLCFTGGGCVFAFSGKDTGTLKQNFILCFLPDGDGNYDITNNAVLSTPGPQNYRSQNASLQQSWEMNYQEAAIYLQV